MEHPETATESQNDSVHQSRRVTETHSSVDGAFQNNSRPAFHSVSGLSCASVIGVMHPSHTRAYLGEFILPSVIYLCFDIMNDYIILAITSLIVNSPILKQSGQFLEMDFPFIHY